MQTDIQRPSSSHFGQIATALRIAGWSSFVIQAGLTATSGVLLLLTISGRMFNQEIDAPSGIPMTAVATQGTTPGLGIGIFWAVCGLLVLPFGIYFAFRLIRFSKRLRSPNPADHPQRGKVMEVLRLAALTGFVGMFLAILGSGATIGVLLAKSVAQPQGVTIYDPNRVIRSLDVFVAGANITGIAAHFVGAATALGVFKWLHRPLDPV